jgi:ATPase subunit of ABC transporter with duplicated ATPase domains
LDPVFELSSKGIARYGGNYDFYKEQKAIETSALQAKIQSETKSLREARKRSLEVAQRQEKRACQGEKNKMQLVRALRKTLLNRGENTGARLQEKHARIVQESQENLSDLRRQQDVLCEFRIDVQNARLYQGKRLISVHDINFEYIKGTPLWNPSLDFEIFSGERIRITGGNGTGKTTLIRLLTGELAPAQGEIKQSDFSYVFLDQEYTRVCTDLTVFELAQQYNRTHLQDHELKIRLNRALLPYAMWDKRCMTLSGGEKMRLYLCCLMIFDQVPDLFILDEPTNNLDLSGLAILSQTIRNYRGTLLVISHDAHFIHEIGITRELELTLPDWP